MLGGASSSDPAQGCIAQKVNVAFQHPLEASQNCRKLNFPPPQGEGSFKRTRSCSRRSCSRRSCRTTSRTTRTTNRITRTTLRVVLVVLGVVLVVLEVVLVVLVVVLVVLVG